MPLTPEAYASKYASLLVPAIVVDEQHQAASGGLTFVSIRRYINENLGRAEHLVGAEMLRFCDSIARQGRYGASGSRDSFTLHGVNPPVAGVNLGPAIFGFMGKATPAEMILALRLASLWTAVVERQRGLYPTLQLFADANLGMDCNGFAGTYFTTQFPGTLYSRNKQPREYDHQQNRRQTLAEVQPLDLVIPADYSHISVISSVVERSDRRMQVRLSESQHPVFHGVTTTTATIRQTSNGLAMAHDVFVCRPLRIPERANLSDF